MTKIIFLKRVSSYTQRMWIVNHKNNSKWIGLGESRIEGINGLTLFQQQLLLIKGISRRNFHKLS